MGLVKPPQSRDSALPVPDAGPYPTLVVQTLSPYPNQRDRFRAAHIGYILQTFNLLAAFTALDNVLLAMLFTNIVLPNQHGANAPLPCSPGWDSAPG